MSNSEPRPFEADGRRRIANEILVFAPLFAIVGEAIVSLRVMKDSPQVLDVDPHRNR